MCVFVIRMLCVHVCVCVCVCVCRCLGCILTPSCLLMLAQETSLRALLVTQVAEVQPHLGAEVSWAEVDARQLLSW
jgi:hypothetical protein